MLTGNCELSRSEPLVIEQFECDAEFFEEDPHWRFLGSELLSLIRKLVADITQAHGGMKKDDQDRQENSDQEEISKNEVGDHTKSDQAKKRMILTNLLGKSRALTDEVNQESKCQGAHHPDQDLSRANNPHQQKQDSEQDKVVGLVVDQIGLDPTTPRLGLWYFEPCRIENKVIQRPQAFHLDFRHDTFVTQ